MLLLDTFTVLLALDNYFNTGRTSITNENNRIINIDNEDFMRPTPCNVMGVGHNFLGVKVRARSSL